MPLTKEFIKKKLEKHFGHLKVPEVSGKVSYKSSSPLSKIKSKHRVGVKLSSI